MHLEYDGVPLDFKEFQPFERVGVYDKWGVDLLYLEWNVGLLAYYSPTGSPAGTAVETRPTVFPTILPEPSKGRIRRIRDYLFGENQRLPPVDVRRDTSTAAPATPPANLRGAARSGKGFGPIVTDKQLFNRLMTPRKRLVIKGDDWSGLKDVEMVSIPRVGNGQAEVCDAIGGPIPLKCDIVSQSEMGFVVYYQIRFATLPCEDASHRLVLSHRYDSADIGSDTGYHARRVEGEIVFNGAMVHTHKISPDKFRQQFFLPIPLGHKRQVEYVRAIGDGLKIEYGYVDQDQTIVFDPGDSGATHLEIAEKLGFYPPRYESLVTAESSQRPMNVRNNKLVV